jgi:hypothetical protein
MLFLPLVLSLGFYQLPIGWGAHACESALFTVDGPALTGGMQALMKSMCIVSFWDGRGTVEQR